MPTDADEVAVKVITDRMFRAYHQAEAAIGTRPKTEAETIVLDMIMEVVLASVLPERPNKTIAEQMTEFFNKSREADLAVI